MLPNFKLLSLLAPVLVMWFPTGAFGGAQTRPQSPELQHGSTISARGKQRFASTCAGCPGLDGRGGERAPNIAESPGVQRLSDAQIGSIIENGIPGTGMPAFHSLETSEVKAVVTYMRTLHGTRKGVKLPGDPERGERIFFGKTGCSDGHMVSGKGGFIASDLSDYVRTHAADQVRAVISSPSAGGGRQGLTVTATIRGGEKYFGRIRNEDNFSVQLQTLDGRFHFQSKSDIETFAYNSQTPMPTDYASILSPKELNDVVS